MILGLYRLLTILGTPLITSFLKRRLAHGKEDRHRFGERLGIAGLPRPAGRLIWLHAASVGESVSMLPVIEHLVTQAEQTVLVTTGTVTSADLMAKRLPNGAIHQYAPVDRLPWVRRFLDHWRPDLALWAESEFWPNLVTETADRSIPMILLNGRVSDTSYARWSCLPGVIRRLLSGFVLCLGQTPTDTQRLAALGAPKVSFCGNLKFASPPLPVDDAQLTALADSLNGRPRWLAASTHDGEELIAAETHRLLAAAHPRLLTIIVPRHPKRGAAIAEQLGSLGLAVRQRSICQEIDENCGILLADTMGELGLFMRLAPIVFMGKSLAGQGGQNPLEPARLGASVMFGPHMGNFQDIAQRMCAVGAAERVSDVRALTEAVRLRLADAALVARTGAMARTFASTEDGVLDAVLAELQPWLATPTRHHHAGA
ncbi:MAG TPA: 3-deoxy-D-manno-octulosonic acid transferase [Rhodospirillaceae bacterium]|nr:3-deoxy-D-manno-octulosonic acid transferase [Rhodospirillaceae bacterium]